MEEKMRREEEEKQWSPPYLYSFRPNGSDSKGKTYFAADYETHCCDRCPVAGSRSYGPS